MPTERLPAYVKAIINVWMPLVESGEISHEEFKEKIAEAMEGI